MIERSAKRLSMRTLVVDDELPDQTADGRASRALVEELQARNVDVVEATSAEDGMAVVTSDSAIHAILVDWTLDDDDGHVKATELLRFVRSRNDHDPDLPDGRTRRGVLDLPIEVMEQVDEFIWTLEDTAAFVGGRVGAVHPALPRGDAAAAGRGADEVRAGVRVLLAHAGPHRRHRVPEVAGRPRSSSTTSARTCCAPTCRSASANSARCSTTPARSASARSTRPGCSARTAPTASPTAPRRRTG